VLRETGNKISRKQIGPCRALLNLDEPSFASHLYGRGHLSSPDERRHHDAGLWPAGTRDGLVSCPDLSSRTVWNVTLNGEDNGRKPTVAASELWGQRGTLYLPKFRTCTPVPPSQRCGLCRNFKQTTLTTRLYKVRTDLYPPHTYENVPTRLDVNGNAEFKCTGWAKNVLRFFNTPYLLNRSR